MTGSQHGFAKTNFYQTNLISLYDRVTNGMHEATKRDIIYMDLVKAFNTAQQDILLSELEQNGLDRLTVSSIQKLLELLQAKGNYEQAGVRRF